MPARGIFGVSPYKDGRRQDGSSWFRPPQPTPVAPSVKFLQTSDPREPQGDAGSNSIVSPRPVSVAAPVRSFLQTDIPQRPYQTVINLVRGAAGAAAAPPTSPPPNRWIDTAPPFQETRQLGDAWWSPYFQQYDPLGGGAFLSMGAPYQMPHYRGGSESVVFFIPPFVRGESPGRFVRFDFYQTPWRLEGSTVFLPAPPSANLVPRELYRFVVGPPPWRFIPGYVFDASWFLEPQVADKPPAPPPTAGVRKSPAYMRRLKLLGIREDGGIRVEWKP